MYVVPLVILITSPVLYTLTHPVPALLGTYLNAVSLPSGALVSVVLLVFVEVLVFQLAVLITLLTIRLVLGSSIINPKLSRVSGS